MARPRQFDEEAVLRAVRDQFWDAGYAATSLQDLMRVTGLGKGSLYAAFGDKHGLYLTVLRRYADDGDRAVRDAMSATPQAIDALRAYLTVPIGDPDGVAAARGCMLANGTCELATADPDVRDTARRTYESITAALAACVQRARDEGDLAPGDSPTEAARALLAAQQGLVYMGRSGMDVGTLEATARALAEHLLPRPPLGDGTTRAGADR